MTPPRYGNCTCSCHTGDGKIHFVPCCAPEPRRPLDAAVVRSNVKILLRWVRSQPPEDRPPAMGYLRSVGPVLAMMGMALRRQRSIARSEEVEVVAAAIWNATYWRPGRIPWPEGVYGGSHELFRSHARAAIDAVDRHRASKIKPMWESVWDDRRA